MCLALQWTPASSNTGARRLALDPFRRVFIFAMSHELTKQFVSEAKPNTARTFSSPSGHYFPCPVLLQPRTYSYCTHPDHKHTSPPHPHLPSRGHPSFSAGGEAQVSMNPRPFRTRRISLPGRILHSRTRSCLRPSAGSTVVISSGIRQVFDVECDYAAATV
jgi:hypothetical protein